MASVNAIIEGFKQYSLSSLGIVFVIILLTVRSPESSTFHKSLYVSATHEFFFHSIIFIFAFVFISETLGNILKSASRISLAIAL